MKFLQTIHWLEAQAINNPESLAVQTEYEKVTYSHIQFEQLNSRGY